MHSAQQVIYDDAGACPVAARGVTGGVATHARRGRKKAALTYVVTYTLGCATKHWNVFGVLLVGRLFCGVATSLLYSAFESWLVAEHFKVSPPPTSLVCIDAAHQCVDLLSCSCYAASSKLLRAFAIGTGAPLGSFTSSGVIESVLL